MRTRLPAAGGFRLPRCPLRTRRRCGPSAPAAGAHRGREVPRPAGAAPRRGSRRPGREPAPRLPSDVCVGSGTWLFRSFLHSRSRDRPGADAPGSRFRSGLPLPDQSGAGDCRLRGEGRGRSPSLARQVAVVKPRCLSSDSDLSCEAPRTTAPGARTQASSATAGRRSKVVSVRRLPSHILCHRRDWVNRKRCWRERHGKTLCHCELGPLFRPGFHALRVEGHRRLLVRVAVSLIQRCCWAARLTRVAAPAPSRPRGGGGALPASRAGPGTAPVPLSPEGRRASRPAP